MKLDEAVATNASGVKEKDWLAWVFLAIAWFAALGTHSLFDPDEGRYAEIPREMFASGDWITPMLNGLPYFEKPPLQYWATTALYSLVGPSEAASRFWAFALAFGCLPLTYWLARGLGFARPIAWRAVFLLAVSPFFVLLGHVNLLDQGFTFFSLVALATFLVGQNADAERHARLLITAWCALAAAVLSKGLVALVLTGGTLVLYAAVQRDATFLKRIWQPIGFALFMLLVVPWFVLVELRNPGFSQFFFVHEHFARFLTKAHRRDGPVWYFLPLVLLAVLPAFGAWRRGISSAWRDAERDGGFPALRSLVLWCAFVLVFFSVSRSKLPPYVLPLVPPLMLMLARVMDDDVRASGRALLVQTVLISLGVVAMLLFDRKRDGVVDVPVYWACGLAVASVAIAWLLRVWRRPRAQHALWMPIAMSALFAWQGLLVAYAVLPPERSSRDMVRAIRDEIRPTTRLFSVRQYRHSLSFYLGRTMTLVDYRGELDEGVRRLGEGDPLRYIGDLKTFVEVWREQKDAIAFIDSGSLDALRAEGFEGRPLAEDDPRSIVMARR